MSYIRGMIISKHPTEIHRRHPQNINASNIETKSWHENFLEMSLKLKQAQEAETCYA